MKISSLHRKQQAKTVASIKRDRKIDDVAKTVDISAQVARARSSFVASREEFAARAAKARKSFPATTHSVMLG